MPRALPALISRPLLDAVPPPADPRTQVVRQDLTAGLPARIDLADLRSQFAQIRERLRKPRTGPSGGGTP